MWRNGRLKSTISRSWLRGRPTYYNQNFERIVVAGSVQAFGTITLWPRTLADKLASGTQQCHLPAMSNTAR